MRIRPFRPEDATALAELSLRCGRRQGEFVLNPLWETEAELFAEFERHGIAPETHLLVACGKAEEVIGMAGFLRSPGSEAAGLLCPILRREERGRGVGGALLRAAFATGSQKLGIRLLTGGVGTRNRAGYALLSAHGFRPVRQVYAMRCSADAKAAVAPLAKLRMTPATIDDAEAILKVYSACGFPPRSLEVMEGLFNDGRHEHLVARKRNREVVAFVELETHWPERPWVAFVGVRPELRDQGLGSSLVSSALARRFEAGATAALLMLSPANRSAVRAYEKVGFRRHRLLDVLERPL